jgi:hypothetical protein
MDAFAIAAMVVMVANFIATLMIIVLLLEVLHRLMWQRQVFVPWLNNIGAKIGLDNKIPDPPPID